MKQTNHHPVGAATCRPPRFCIIPFLMLILALALCQTAFAAAEEPTDIVNDAEGLLAWFIANKESGGSVTFGSDIIVDDLLLTLSADAKDSGAKIIINTAEFGLKITGDLQLDNCVSIIGKGSPKAVVFLGADARLIENDLVNVTAPMPWITATGENGTALEFGAGSSAFINTSAYLSLRVSALGENGIAIRSATPLISGISELNKLVIEATAPGGRGIVSTEPIKLLLCSVTADTAAVEAPSVTLDTCSVSPSVPDAELIQRTLTFSPLFITLISALDIGNTDYLEAISSGFYTTAVLSVEGHDDIGAAFLVTFDTSQVDINAPGFYPMPVAAFPAPYDLAINSLSEFEIEIFDPSVPRFSTASRSFGYYILTYTYAGQPDQLLLWRSDDLGETWYEYWRGEDDTGISDNLEVYFDYDMELVFSNPGIELAGEVLLVFQIVDTEISSQVLYLDYSKSSIENGFGGDRTGLDRFPFPWLSNNSGGGSGNGSNTDPPSGGNENNTPPPGGGDWGNGNYTTPGNNTNPPAQTDSSADDDEGDDIATLETQPDDSDENDSLLPPEEAENPDEQEEADEQGDTENQNNAEAPPDIPVTSGGGTGAGTNPGGGDTFGDVNDFGNGSISGLDNPDSAEPPETGATDNSVQQQPSGSDLSGNETSNTPESEESALSDGSQPASSQQTSTQPGSSETALPASSGITTAIWVASSLAAVSIGGGAAAFFKFRIPKRH